MADETRKDVSARPPEPSAKLSATTVEPVLFAGDHAVRDMSLRIASPQFAEVIEAVVRSHMTSQTNAKKKADPFVFEIQNMLKAAQYHLDGLLNDEVALRLYTHARPHFTHARDILAPAAESPEERDALAVLDGIIRVADAARPVLFPNGIPSQDDPNYGSKPHGRVRKKPTTGLPGDSTSPIR